MEIGRRVALKNLLFASHFSLLYLFIVEKAKKKRKETEIEEKKEQKISKQTEANKLIKANQFSPFPLPAKKQNVTPSPHPPLETAPISLARFFSCLNFEV